MGVYVFGEIDSNFNNHFKDAGGAVKCENLSKTVYAQIMNKIKKL